MNLALRDIRYNALRFLLTALGIGLLTAGTLTINGIYNGIVADALNLIERLDADLWVVEEGTSGPFVDGSQVNLDLERRLEGIAGVAAVRRFDTLPSTAVAATRSVDVTLLAVSFPFDAATWVPLVRGRPLAAPRGEAVADRTAGFAVGDRISVAGEELEVVGVMAGMVETNGEPVVVVSAADFDAVRAVPAKTERPVHRGAGSGARWPSARTGAAMLVDVEPWADSAEVAARIEDFGDASVLTEAAERDLIVNGRLARMRLQILIFSGLLTLITAVVVTLTIYTMTVEKQHTIALLKLIGARDSTVAGLILFQALMLAVLGILAGLVLQQAIAPAFPRRVVLLLSDVGLLSATLLVTCLAGSGLGIAKALSVRAQEILS